MISETIMIEPVPVKKNFKGNFGQERTSGSHPGTDIPAASGTEVKAPMDGKVVNVKSDQWPCGGTIDIDYKNGFWSRFCHMKKINVEEGDIVKQGDVVGLSGGGSNDFGRGRSDGPHLHFTLRKDGKNVDPVDYLQKTVPDSEIETDSETKTDSEVTKSDDKKSFLDKLSPEERKKFNMNLLGLLGMAESKNNEEILKETIRIKELMK